MAAYYESGSGLTQSLSEVLAEVSRIDGVDVELALSRISGKQDLLRSCIEQTAYSIDGTLRKMSVCLSDGDLRGFSIEAHGLKVALASIGATDCSEHASRLEKASKDGRAPECKAEFIGFAGTVKRLAAELKSALPGEKAEKKIKGDGALLLKVAGKAGEFLGAFEADDALSCMESLDAFTFGDETDALLSHIRNRIKAFKYDEAMLLLKSIG